MGVCRVLDEAVEQEYHLIPLKHVFTHNLNEYIQTVLQEVYFRLQRVIVKQLVRHLRQRFSHQSECVLGFCLVSFILCRGLVDAYHRIYLLHALREKNYQVTEVKHVPGHNIY